MKNNDLSPEDKDALKHIRKKARIFSGKEGAYDSHGMHVEEITPKRAIELLKKSH